MTVERSVSLAKMFQLATGLMAMLALLLAYLVPLHFPPWTTFYGEWLFAVFVGLGVAWTISHGRPILADVRPWIAILLLVSLHAWTWGDMTPMRSTLWVVFLGFGIVGWLAYSLGLNLRHTPWLNAVLFVIWLAAMVSSAIAVLQWSGVVSAAAWGPEFVVFSVGGGRAASNIGQPNNLGTLLILGMGVVGYAWYTDERRSVVWRGLAVLSLVVLVLGTYLCDSRTALLNLTLWPVLLFGWARWRRSPWPWLALLPIAMLGALHLIMPVLIDWWGGAPVAVRAVGSRPRVWLMVLTAIGEHPWLGQGFGAVANSHLRLAPEFGAFDWTIAHHAHNIILDMWVVFGLPLGTLIVAAGIWLWVRAWLESRTIAEQFLWAMATAILVHGMLELAMHHGFFFWLWCLLLGVLGGREWKAWSPRLTLPVSMAWLVLFLSVALPVRTEYAQMEALFTTLRVSGPEAARSELLSAPKAFGPRFFPEIYERLYWLSTSFDEMMVMSDKDLAALETEASWNPLPYLGWGTAYAFASRGNAVKAAWWAERMCRMFRPEQCDEAAGKWHRRHEKQPSWPDLPFERWQTTEAKRAVKLSVTGSQAQ